jgi:hypothetical protein
MARTYGKLLAAAWIDPDWCGLTPLEQWLYALLLSQPKLSLVGVLDYKPGRWATLARGADTTLIDDTLAGLEDARFVVVDYDTDELLLRSFTRHDGIPATNERLVKGLWQAWTSTASAVLRKVVVDNMPEVLLGGDAPDAARHLRCSTPLRLPLERAIQRPIEWAHEQANGRVHDSPEACNRSLQPRAQSDAQSDRRLSTETIEQGMAQIAAIRNGRGELA